MSKFNCESILELESEERYRLISPSKILSEVNMKEDLFAADLGCGTGFFTIPASEILGKDGKIYAFDIDNKMLTYLRTRIEAPNIIPILIEDAYKIPLKNYFLDFALTAFILYEVSDYKNFLQEVKRILKHNAILVILDWIKKDQDKGPSIHQRIFQQDLIQVLYDMNFKILQSRVINHFHYLIEAQVNHQYFE